MSRFQLPTEIPPGGVALEGTPYHLLAVLGSGGQGIAYKVANTEAGGRFECLKVLLNVRERELVERFLREKDTLASVKHKSIVHMIRSFWLPDGRPAFTMEFIDGLSVKQLLSGANPLPVRQAVTIASEVADGLIAAHAKGFVHRDIKPANIIVGHDGTVKIIDFGVAKVLQSDPGAPEEKLTINPGLIGTMVYASPEMLWRFVATPESDLYSLGLVLYEMLTGKRPFRAKSAVELAELMRTTPPPPLAAAGQGGPFPDQLDWTVRSLLKANVDERTRTAREVRRQLEAIKRLLPNDAQIEVSADAVADDVTVAATQAGTYPEAIAATGPAPVPGTGPLNYPSSVPTAPSSSAITEDGTVRSHAFAPRSSAPAEVVHATAPQSRSALPWVLLAVLVFAAAGVATALLVLRPGAPTEKSGAPGAPIVTSSATPSPAPTPSVATAKQPTAGSEPPSVNEPASTTTGVQKKPMPGAKPGTPMATTTTAPPSITVPPPIVSAPATTTASPPAPPPGPGGAMDDRL